MIAVETVDLVRNCSEIWEGGEGPKAKVEVLFVLRKVSDFGIGGEWPCGIRPGHPAVATQVPVKGCC